MSNYTIYDSYVGDGGDNDQITQTQGAEGAGPSDPSGNQ